MEPMTELHPSAGSAGHRHDYLPAAGHDHFLPFYDLLSAALGAPKLHRTLIGQAGLTAGQRVLEIGCGTGNLCIRVNRAHPDVELVGTDPDPLALDRARRKTRGRPGIEFEQAYAQKLPYPDASFDRVLSALMLHHMDHDTKVAAVAEVRRVLRPGGTLHLVDFAGQSGPHGLHGFLSRRVLPPGHFADHTTHGIPRLLRDAGLDCTEVATQHQIIMGPVAYYRATRPG